MFLQGSVSILVTISITIFILIFLVIVILLVIFQSVVLCFLPFGLACLGLRERQRWLRVQGLGFSHRLHGSCFWGLPYGILNMSHKKELLWSL